MLKLRSKIHAVGALVVAATMITTSSHAEFDVKITTRPLTAQEIVDFGLTNTTQKAGGIATVGVGQPAYLSLLAESGVVVTQASWEITSRPIGSTANIQNGPLDVSIPPYDAATMTIANAVEMGYLPAGTGTVVRFQAIDTLQGGGWTNVGPTNISTGNWMHHLESIRDLDNRFFRAVEKDNL